MTIRPATDADAARWDAFLAAHPRASFLQSWTMGEVYRDIGQEPVRVLAEDGGNVVAVCQAIHVPARRGKHLAVMYGPVGRSYDAGAALLDALRREARARGCSFVRASPFSPAAESDRWTAAFDAQRIHAVRSPLHLLAEHVWYLPLDGATEESLLAGMRKTTRNLVRRAEKDGVTVRASTDPLRDVEHFVRLHDETRKRHKFTPYTNAFFRAQVKRFAPRGECTVYMAEYQGQVIAASIHMHAFGETSYHHGASDSAHAKVPASYLVQWTAIRDALKRGDRTYNFWGIAPMKPTDDGGREIADKSHPFAGVTLFKTGFGGELLDLVHCMDLPLRPSYALTRWFETFRKWKRGF